MSNILKIEAFSGASGDMFLSALADLCNSYDELKSLPKILNFSEDAEIEIFDTSKNGIACKQVRVKELREQKKHRHLSHINEIIKDSELNEKAKQIALEIFNIIGEAESAVHNIPLEKIHFHEVGAVDSIIDICGAAYLLDKLNIQESYLKSLVVGKGFVNTEHGLLPIPAPATKMILQDIPYETGDEDGEKLTPTGAAIIKYLNPKFENTPLIDIKTAYGSGEKDFTHPNVLRLSLSRKANNPEQMYIVETNIDDNNSEYLGIEFQDKLIENGAVDFYFNQVVMKKGRPGLVLSVICKGSDLKKVTSFILASTSTIGLRYYPAERIELPRKTQTVETEYGKFRVKISETEDGKEKVKPESEDILKYSLEHGVSPNIISQKIVEAYSSKK